MGGRIDEVERRGHVFLRKETARKATYVGHLKGEVVPQVAPNGKIDVVGIWSFEALVHAPIDGVSAGLIAARKRLGKSGWRRGSIQVIAGQVHGWNVLYASKTSNSRRGGWGLDGGLIFKVGG